MKEAAPRGNTKPRDVQRRNRAASERALIDAGIALFAAVGYEAATTRAIAARAGLNEQLITRYFGGKAGLLAAVYLDFIEKRDNDALYEAQPLAPDAKAEIRSFMHFKHEHIAEVNMLLRVVVPQLFLDPTLLPMLNDPIVLRGGAVLTKRLEAIRRAGKIAPQTDIRRIAALVVTQSLALSFLNRHLAGGRDGEILRLIDTFADTIGAGIA